jgi:hypothetical protein
LPVAWRAGAVYNRRRIKRGCPVMQLTRAVPREIPRGGLASRHAGTRSLYQ